MSDDKETWQRGVLNEMFKIFNVPDIQHVIKSIKTCFITTEVY